MSGKDPCTLYNKFNFELVNLSQWLFANKLVLNVKKTNYMIFTKRHINIDCEVKLGNESIKCVSSLKFLGVTIDNTLSWHEHNGVVCNQVSKGVGILYRLRQLPHYIRGVDPFLRLGGEI